MISLKRPKTSSTCEGARGSLLHQTRPRFLPASPGWEELESDNLRKFPQFSHSQGTGKRENQSKTSPGGGLQAGSPCLGTAGWAQLPRCPLCPPRLAVFKYHVCRLGKDKEWQYKYKLSDKGKGEGRCPVKNPKPQSNTSLGCRGLSTPGHQEDPANTIFRERYGGVGSKLWSELGRERGARHREPNSVPAFCIPRQTLPQFPHLRQVVTTPPELRRAARDLRARSHKVLQM